MPLVRSREATFFPPFDARAAAADLLPSFPAAATFSAPAASLPADVVEDQLAAFQQEVDGLRHEVDALRRRDCSINFYERRLDEELRLAAKLQQDFLPRALPAVGPVRFHAAWRPAGYVSGDLYDVVRLDEEHIGFYIADAVGHGVPAALLTMFIKNALVTKDITPTSYRLLDPGESLGRLNEALIAQPLQTGTFCTACYAVLNVRTLVLRVATAGHPAPYLLRGDDPPAVLKTDGPLLGIFDGEAFATTVHQLRPGDRLVLYTDGGRWPSAARASGTGRPPTCGTTSCSSAAGSAGRS